MKIQALLKDMTKVKADNNKLKGIEKEKSSAATQYPRKNDDTEDVIELDSEK